MMKQAASAIAAIALITSTSSLAQTSHERKVDHDTSVHNGVTTTTTKVTDTSKRKTNQPKKILGVKVGHKTKTTKVVRETAVSSNGDRKAIVKTSH